MMSVAAIKKAVESLPSRQRHMLMRQLLEQWEDYQDLRALVEGLMEPGDWVPARTLKKKLDAKFRRLRS